MWQTGEIRVKSGEFTVQYRIDSVVIVYKDSKRTSNEVTIYLDGKCRNILIKNGIKTSSYQLLVQTNYSIHTYILSIEGTTVIPETDTCHINISKIHETVCAEKQIIFNAKFIENTDLYGYIRCDMGLNNLVYTYVIETGSSTRVINTRICTLDDSYNPFNVECTADFVHGYSVVIVGTRVYLYAVSLQTHKVTLIYDFSIEEFKIRITDIYIHKTDERNIVVYAYSRYSNILLTVTIDLKTKRYLIENKIDGCKYFTKDHITQNLIFQDSNDRTAIIQLKNKAITEETSGYTLVFVGAQHVYYSSESQDNRTSLHLIGIDPHTTSKTLILNKVAKKATIDSKLISITEILSTNTDIEFNIGMLEEYNNESEVDDNTDSKKTIYAVYTVYLSDTKQPRFKRLSAIPLNTLSDGNIISVKLWTNSRGRIKLVVTTIEEETNKLNINWVTLNGDKVVTNSKVSSDIRISTESQRNKFRVVISDNYIYILVPVNTENDGDMGREVFKLYCITRKLSILEIPIDETAVNANMYTDYMPCVYISLYNERNKDEGLEYFNNIYTLSRVSEYINGKMPKNAPEKELILHINENKRPEEYNSILQIQAVHQIRNSIILCTPTKSDYMHTHIYS